MSTESQEYSNLPGDATGIGEAEGPTGEQRAEETRAALRRSEDLMQSTEDAHWEDLISRGRFPPGGRDDNSPMYDSVGVVNAFSRLFFGKHRRDLPW
jgi:hypothetical protein